MKWSVRQWAQIKAWVQLLLAVFVVVVWVFMIINKGVTFTMDDLIRLITLIYFSSTGGANLAKDRARKIPF